MYVRGRGTRSLAFTTVRGSYISCRGSVSRQPKTPNSATPCFIPDTNLQAPRHRPIFMTNIFPNSLFSQLFIISSNRSARRAIENPKNRGCSCASRVTSQPNSSPHALNFTLESLLASQVLAVNNTNQPITSHFFINPISSITQLLASYRFTERTPQ